MTQPHPSPPALPAVAPAPAAHVLVHERNDLVALRHLKTHGGGEFPETPMTATTLGFTLGAERPVSWILEGRVRSTRMREGDMVLFPEASPVGCSWSRPSEFVMLAIATPLVAALSEEAGHGRPPIRARLPLRDPAVERVVRTLLAEASRPRLASALMRDCLATELAVLLMRASQGGDVGTAPPVGRLASARLRRVEEYVHAHLEQRIDLRSMAVAAGLSLHHFARSFRASTGVTPMAYVTRIRVERARERLERTDDGIVEIALAVGYDSASHFAKVFARAHGCTPSAWRRR